ncbi:DUF6531 domain-containing protein [Rhodocytophaga aerolata]|uniref:DUF6531 domain-containing protein n=1 Tax=Rhodocytophaga aerolata TaxID=455078 RepID=A0ABT8RET6_9BACT|nr:DUF6531 domain-containing protein [Rhodocytophaga aerolata]MDO1450206.1 DUF6531 domain-containing protein [Rhodocytophaga aerolata]
MNPAAKFFDPVIGIDIHIVKIGPTVLPIPHPFVGIVWDPADYAPIIGSKTRVNGVPASQAGSGGSAKPSHFPLGEKFIKSVGDDCEVFMGSSTVLTDGEPFSYMSLRVLSCSCVGMPSPFRAGKEPTPSLKLPTSVVLPIPSGNQVLIGGSPTVSMSALAMKGIMSGIGGCFKKIRNKVPGKKGMKNASDVNGVKKLDNGKKTCLSDPVDVATGEVIDEYTDIELPGPIPFKLERVWYSSSRYRGPLGSGWHHSYDMALFIDEKEEMICVRLKEGRLIGFPLLALNESFYDRTEKLTLLHDQNGYALRDKEELYYRFSPVDNHKFLLSKIENTNGHSIQFQYAKNDRGNYISRIIDSGGRELLVSTDDHNRILSIASQHPEANGRSFHMVQYEYDWQGDLIAVRDAVDKAMTYQYDSHLMAKKTNRTGLSFYYRYNKLKHDGKCVHVWGDGGIHECKLEYFVDEFMTLVTNSLGHQTTYYWNAAGLVTETINAKADSRYQRYNVYNELIEEYNELGLGTKYEYDERGNQTKVTYPDGASIQMEYDEQDHLIAATDAVRGKWQWQYDAQGNLIERLDCLERITQYEYQNGQLIKVIDAAGNEFKLSYDEQFNLKELIMPDTATTRWEYDQLGRCIASIDPNGNIQSRRFNQLGQVIRIDEPDGNQRLLTYDEEGNVRHVKDQQHEAHFTYQGVNRLASRTEEGTTVEFQYDTEGQLTGIKNELGFVYRFEIDPLGNITKEVGFDLQERIYERNAAGQVTMVHRPEKHWTRYDYDRAGRVIQVTYHDETQEKYAYRPDGKMLLAENQYQKVQFERDLLGMVTKEIQGKYEVISTYDILGNRIALSSTWGAKIDLVRNAMGDLEQLFAQNGEQAAWQTSFKRDLLGLEIERSLPGGIHSSIERDKLGRPIHQQISGTKGYIIDKRYEWDVNDRLQKIIDTKKGTTTFTHDPLGNLISAQYGDGTFEFRMPDAVGNLFRTRDRSDRKYGPAGQLQKSGNTYYEYDEEGNLIRKTETGGKEWRYIWNAYGMLSKVIRPDGEAVTFTYDALGRRLSKTFRNKITRWVWDGNIPLHEWIESTTLFKASYRTIEQMAANGGGEVDNNLITWLFEPESFTPLAKLTKMHSYGIINDYLSTPLSMHTDSGETVWSADLNSYGGVVNLLGKAEDCPFRYPGQYEDVETGLYYNRFRYYDAKEGIYVSQDPIGLKSEILNFYRYVDDPLVWSDEFGLKCGQDNFPFETTRHFRNRLAQRQSRGITRRNAIDAYNNGRLYYNRATKNYIRHSSRTGVSVVVSKPSGGKAITVFEGNASPSWEPVRWRL